MRTKPKIVQLALFPEARPRLLTEQGSPKVRLPPALDAPPPWTQVHLFAEPIILRTSIERAIAAGDFREAAALRETLARDHAPSWLPDDLDFLDGLAPCCWEPPDPAALLVAWHAAARGIGSQDRRRQVADAFFVRLARCASPSEIAERDACCLPDIVGALWRQGSDDVARSLVRDALLAGRELAPASFEHPTVEDILMEDCTPPRLACLGALRHAWPAPRASDDDVAAVQRSLAEPPPEGEASRALAFWECMRVAELLRRRPDDLRLEVRKRMRMLDTELHALYMERLT